ncbi:unnamed protein product [Coregonus sp. 'balchen']|nr:unnamed protein product [Coregonus sp. 'balchen']
MRVRETGERREERGEGDERGREEGGGKKEKEERKKREEEEGNKEREKRSERGERERERESVEEGNRMRERGQTLDMENHTQFYPPIFTQLSSSSLSLSLSLSPLSLSSLSLSISPQLFTISFSWASHEVRPPKYQHHDPLTSELLLCDQCPPGTAVLTHCTADTPTACSPCPDRSFSEHWHWGDSCQYCTTVCKERQLVRQECNSTHDQLCECVPGYHLVVEFCIKHTPCQPGYGVAALGRIHWCMVLTCSVLYESQLVVISVLAEGQKETELRIPGQMRREEMRRGGERLRERGEKRGTPEVDTVCEACPQGLFSSRVSASEPCVSHRNCSELGLKTLRLGTTTQDTLCENEAKGSVLECSHHHTQCHTGENIQDNGDICQTLLSKAIYSHARILFFVWVAPVGIKSHYPWRCERHALPTEPQHTHHVMFIKKE